MSASHADIELMLGAPVRELATRPSPYRTSFELYEVDAVTRDGQRLELMLKVGGVDALSAEARTAKLPFMHESAREVRVYRELLGHTGDWAPALRGCVLDPSAGRYWLLINRGPGRELFQVGELETWRATAAWLARMHRQLTPRALPLDLPLLRHDRRWHERWIERALAFGRPGPALSRLLTRPEWLVDRMLDLPVGFVHGELYASNVLVESGAHGDVVRAVDWELAGLGCGLYDLAALTSGGWSEADRRAIADGYRRELDPGDRLSAEAEFFGALRICRLQLAVQWLGWSPHWAPPEHLAHDWRAEGELLAEEVAPSAA